MVIGNTGLAALPEGWGDLDNLKEVIVEDNAALVGLPEGWGAGVLSRVYVNRNAGLVSLPASLAASRSLYELEVRDNPSLVSLPEGRLGTAWAIEGYRQCQSGGAAGLVDGDQPVRVLMCGAMGSGGRLCRSIGAGCVPGTLLSGPATAFPGGSAMVISGIICARRRRRSWLRPRGWGLCGCRLGGGLPGGLS